MGVNPFPPGFTSDIPPAAAPLQAAREKWQAFPPPQRLGSRKKPL